MVKRFAACLALASSLAAAAVPTPAEHLGYMPGEDFKLADYADVTSYFHKLAASSDRIRLEEFGRSFHGKPMLVAYISSAENLKRLDHWQEINRKLALGQASPEDARRLSAEGKAIVWVDSGLHASEVAPVQHSLDLAYRMVTGESDEVRRIRENVILLQVPVINPDGLDWVVHWYRKNVGTPSELAPLPHLYHEYAGHDNNRDWFMLNLVETRHVTRMFYERWFPHIIYNQHQAPAFPARIFTPPYAEPLNPNIPQPILEGVSMIGAAMRERFAREGKSGVLSYHGYDSWWNGGLRTAPKFHNMHGILTETAIAYSGTATPREYALSDLPPRFASGLPTREPSIFYSRPWLGGKWGTRDAIEYMLTADFAILELAASRPQYFLQKAYDLARAAIESGSSGRPHAYIVPAGQWDFSAACDMVERLRLAGLEVYRASTPFSAGARTYPAGSFVLPAAQPFRAYLVDLLEPQRYPELKLGQTGSTKQPYDIAGWTMPLNMGVQVDRAEDRFQAQLERSAGPIEIPESRSHRENSSFLTLARMLKSGRRILWSADGEMQEGDASGGAFELKAPRLGLYEPYAANMDTGWTRYVLDQYQVPYRVLRNDEIQGGSWREGLDAILFADQATDSILHGSRDGEAASARRSGDRPALQRPEFTGGIGVAGLHQVEEFVRNGGTLIALGRATAMAVDQFPLPLRALVRNSGEESVGGFYSPGSILRISVDPGQPVGFGMPKDAHAFVSGGQAWDVTLVNGKDRGEREVRVIARYAPSNLLASGWVSGERIVAGRAAAVEARHGRGKAILFGFRPQFRAQSAGTFKLLLNAIYLASAKTL